MFILEGDKVHKLVLEKLENGFMTDSKKTKNSDLKCMDTLLLIIIIMLILMLMLIIIIIHPWL